LSTTSNAEERNRWPPSQRQPEHVSAWLHIECRVPKLIDGDDSVKIYPRKLLDLCWYF